MYYGECGNGECGNGEWVLSDQFQVACEKDVLRMCYITSREGPLKIRGKHFFFNLSSPQAAQAQNFFGIFFFFTFMRTFSVMVNISIIVTYGIM